MNSIRRKKNKKVNIESTERRDYMMRNGESLGLLNWETEKIGLIDGSDHRPESIKKINYDKESSDFVRVI